ncbi:MAG TPA: PP2C family protein-serine/threonine phosphatase [Terriglobales bacterium]|nr:PP2C family protein-serine/threonine phosphatase [Terriglobales bacterium]
MRSPHRNADFHRRVGRSRTPQASTSIREEALPTVAQSTDSLGRQRDELHQQLFEAAQIQRKLSGPRSLRIGELECAREVFAARYLSGDFAVLYEFGNKLFAAVGDITGKGTPAGMWFTHLVGLIQRYLVAGADPSQIAAEVNAHLCSLRPLGPFVTMFLAQLDPASGEMTYCNAGHFPPVLLPSRNKFSTLECGGPLLGALPETAYELGQHSLKPGDTLVAYSDGVIECRNDKDEEFGTERLISEASRLTHESAQMTLLTLLGAVQDFTAGQPVCDDMSLMVIRRTAASYVAVA